jgi:hypothetical protein
VFVAEAAVARTRRRQNRVVDKQRQASDCLLVIIMDPYEKKYQVDTIEIALGYQAVDGFMKLRGLPRAVLAVLALGAATMVLIIASGFGAAIENSVSLQVRGANGEVSRRAVSFKFAQLERCSSLPLSLPPHDHARRSHNSAAGSP